MLVSMKHLMEHALLNKYAVGYFEAWNLESVLSVINAAEKMNSPIIIGFSGNFVSNPNRKIAENIYHYGALGKAIAENSKVPCALLLNEAPELDILVRALKAGFNAVMYQKVGESFEEQIKMNKFLVQVAHYSDATVEAEVGELPTADISTGTMTSGRMTDPDEAAYFVKETGIDALAIACGNVHLLEGKKSALDFELIKTLREKIDVPLVLHGGTGISGDDLKEAISLGMCKINVGTIMKRVYIEELKKGLNAQHVDSTDPHEIIGGGGELDIMVKARDAITESVIDFIKLFGSENKAKIM